MWNLFFFNIWHYSTKGIDFFLDMWIIQYSSTSYRLHTYEARNLGINALHRIDYCRKSNLGMCTWSSNDYCYNIQVHDDIVYSEYVNLAHARCNLSCKKKLSIFIMLVEVCHSKIFLWKVLCLNQSINEWAYRMPREWRRRSVTLLWMVTT